MMNIRTRWALVIGLTLATISTTMLLSNNVPVVVKDGNGVSQTFMVVQNAAGGLVAENAICDGQAAAACATVKGSSSAAAATDSAMVVALTPNSPAVTSPQSGTLTWPPGTAPVTGVGSFTTSPTAGSNFVAAVQIGSAPTLTTSPVAGSNNVQVNGVTVTVTTSGAAGTNFVAPVAVGGTVITSNSVSALVTPVNCIIGCASGTTQAVSPAVTTLVQTGFPADAVCGSDTGTCSEIALIKRTNQLLDSPLPTQAGTVSIGGVGLLAQTSGGCTSQYLTASTTNLINLVKQVAGTLCWMRIVNASTITATVRAYDTSAVNQQAVCGGSTLPISYDLVQPNSVSPGSVNNMGPYGMNFASGLAICITGSAGGTFGFQDQTTLTTNALFVNIGFK